MSAFSPSGFEFDWRACWNVFNNFCFMNLGVSSNINYLIIVKTLLDVSQIVIRCLQTSIFIMSSGKGLQGFLILYIWYLSEWYLVNLKRKGPSIWSYLTHVDIVSIYGQSFKKVGSLQGIMFAASKFVLVLVVMSIRS